MPTKRTNLKAVPDTNDADQMLHRENEANQHVDDVPKDKAKTKPKAKVKTSDDTDYEKAIGAAIKSLRSKAVASMARQLIIDGAFDDESKAKVEVDELIKVALMHLFETGNINWDLRMQVVAIALKACWQGLTVYSILGYTSFDKGNTAKSYLFSSGKLTSALSKLNAASDLCVKIVKYQPKGKTLDPMEHLNDQIKANQLIADATKHMNEAIN